MLATPPDQCRKEARSTARGQLLTKMASTASHCSEDPDLIKIQAIKNVLNITEPSLGSIKNEGSICLALSGGHKLTSSNQICWYVLSENNSNPFS